MRKRSVQMEISGGLEKIQTYDPGGSLSMMVFQNGKEKTVRWWEAYFQRGHLAQPWSRFTLHLFLQLVLPLVIYSDRESPHELTHHAQMCCGCG